VKKSTIWGGFFDEMGFGSSFRGSRKGAGAAKGRKREKKNLPRIAQMEK